VELFIKCIFGLETELNFTQAEKFFIQWPLKTTDRYHDEQEFVYMYSLLNTDSLFWSSLFKLSNLSTNLRLPLNLLPLFLKSKIESGHSFLSPRVDNTNCLNLSKSGILDLNLRERIQNYFHF
jgi:hypothetical protein